MDPQQQSVAEEFDGYHETYDHAVNRAIAFSGQKVEAFTRAKALDLIKLLSLNFPSINDLTVLDIGCGIGNYHPILSPVISRLHGVDVSPACIEKARQKNTTTTFTTYDGERLPYPDATFDAVFCVCVIHHVPPEKWTRFVQEAARVTRSQGLIVIYEHNPANPLTRKVVRDCAFDRDAVLVTKDKARELLENSGCSDITTKSILTIPPWPGMMRLDSLFSKFPFGTQYRAVGRLP